MKLAAVLLLVSAAIAVSAVPAAATAVRCSGSQLSGSFTVQRGSAGAGNIVYTLALKNTSATLCTLTGLPAGQLLGRLHNPLATHIRAANPGALTAVLVTLLPRQSTFASARFSPDVPGPGEGQVGRCEPTSDWFRVRGQGGGVTIVPLKPPTPVCEHGTLSFSAYSVK